MSTLGLSLKSEIIEPLEKVIFDLQVDIFARFGCSFSFTRFECGFIFTRFECGFIFTRFECSFQNFLGLVQTAIDLSDFDKNNLNTTTFRVNPKLDARLDGETYSRISVLRG